MHDLSKYYFFFISGQRRALYDQFGEEGLKNGVPTTTEGTVQFWYWCDFKTFTSLLTFMLTEMFLDFLNFQTKQTMKSTSEYWINDFYFHFPPGEYTRGYVFHGDPERVFKEFFGGDNPYSG